jgi:hypothetical protein
MFSVKRELNFETSLRRSFTLRSFDDVSVLSSCKASLIFITYLCCIVFSPFTELHISIFASNTFFGLLCPYFTAIGGSGNNRRLENFAS